MATVLESAGPWVECLAYEQLPEPVIQTTKRAVLDFIGVALAGSEHELTPVLLDYLGVTGAADTAAAGLIGRSERASIEGAAFINSVFGHVLDFDDSSDTLLGHPTVVILPPLLALGETRHRSGQELITAYVAGVEVAAHIGKQMNIAHYERGWHPTATLAIFGTAAAAAKLLGLTAAGIANALAIVSAFPSGTRSSFGTHMKSIQVGEAARRGLTAALLASAGVEGNLAAFEDQQGFAASYNGSDGFAQKTFDVSSSRTWDLIDPGLVIKQYPCCASAHSAVDAAIDLRRELRPDDIVEKVRIRLHPRRLRHTNNPKPASPLEAKFSVQYAVAVALNSGAVTLGDFDQDALRRPALVELVAKTTAEALPQQDYGPEHYAAEVELRLGDGSTRQRRVEKARGRGTKLALTDAEVEQKFHTCADPVLGAGNATTVLTTIMALETSADLATLMHAVVP